MTGVLLTTLAAQTKFQPVVLPRSIHDYPVRPPQVCLTEPCRHTGLKI